MSVADTVVGERSCVSGSQIRTILSIMILIIVTRYTFGGRTDGRHALL